MGPSIVMGLTTVGMLVGRASPWAYLAIRPCFVCRRQLADGWHQFTVCLAAWPRGPRVVVTHWWKGLGPSSWL